MKFITTSMAVATAFIFLISPSCSKKSSSSPSCKLITVIDQYGSTTNTINISYNNDGKISTIQGTGSSPFKKVFTYSGNLMMITTSNASSVTATDSVVLNSDGLISYSMRKDASNIKTVYTYTYSGSQLLKSTYQYNGGSIQTTTYTFTNGDLTGSAEGSNTAVYNYYTDKNSADGDFLKLVQLLNYGGLYVKNAHLIKGFQQGSTVENFNYTYDNTGKITGLTATTGSNIENVTFQYNCN
ncbi:hypothetical protein A3860_33645 [Niastella vici]|uniref:DUF4595 domain-containing protein n=1 Tax=Niastella vici TaxID=1703345 RepID=A0A1V9FQE0_9BACT|nr:hypothetical protein [Niastella vici]OQP60466.1 hypothetical protein A3860_33645 [Niastella vici]